MNKNIQPIPYGQENAVLVKFIWDSNPVGCESPVMTAELIGTSGNCLDRRKKEIDKNDYLASEDKGVYLLGIYGLTEQIIEEI